MAAACLALLAAALAGAAGHPEAQPIFAVEESRSDRAVPIDHVCSNEPDKEMLSDLAEFFNEVRSIDRELSGALGRGPRGRRTRDLRARRAKAVGAVAAAGESHFGSFGAQMCVARVLLSLGEPKAALPAARRAVELAPQDVAALILRGMASLRSGDRRQAARDARAILEKSPDNKGASDLYRLATGREFKLRP
ncbi:MAG: tetratricopeptide repeat protein [Elusimicrobia bacterium]|nr:tetratricopeptide repeat protein [Elusimicrobiota bacterium]